jgi:SAM-dependent methyltransferase
MSVSMSAAEWDRRYAGKDLVWGTGANVWVQRETDGIPPGSALDLACGEGRNSIWLASLGWTVTGVDFSSEAIRKAETLAQGAPVTWLCADATTLHLAASYDLVLVVYLQLPRRERAAALTAAWAALAPGGTLLVIAHDTRNLNEGVGGPQDPAALYSAEEVRDIIRAVDPSLIVERCEAVLRPVPAADRPAIDALFRARKSS